MRRVSVDSSAVHLKRREAHSGKVAERELFQARIEMLERLAVTAELRDDSTGEHSYRVGKLASLLAHEFGCVTTPCFMIEMAARLHDVGKIGVPDAILLKPDKLNAAEQEVMRSHSTVGAELLSKAISLKCRWRKRLRGTITNGGRIWLSGAVVRYCHSAGRTNNSAGRRIRCTDA
jgi:putative nucleotidyltransferase with HDIG domain